MTIKTKQEKQVINLSVNDPQMFQSSSSNTDRATLKRKNIPSPNIADMPYRIKEGKAIKFFKTREKYEAYLNRPIN